MDTTEIRDLMARGAGRKGLGETLRLPEGRHLLWMADGKAVWQTDGGVKQDLEGGVTVHYVIGPGVVTFEESSNFVWFDGGDPLGFDPRAAVYHKLLASHNQGVGEALLENFPVKSGDIWVDIGTGTGAMVAALSQVFKPNHPVWILGVDRAGRMLSKAWESTRDTGIPTWFVERDLAKLRWPRSMVDGVTALLLFHLVDDLEMILSRVFLALRPGGRLLYAVSADQNPFVKMIMRQLRGPGDFFKRGQEQIQKQVLGAGFVIEQERTYEDSIAVENPEAMLDLISSIGGPATRGLRRDIVPPKRIPRVFHLVWAKKPSQGAVT